VADSFGALVGKEVVRASSQRLPRVSRRFDCQQSSVGVGEIAPGNLVVHDPQLLEDGLHQHLLDAVGSGLVEASRIGQEAETLIEPPRQVLGRGQVSLNDQFGGR